jgi:hypothetical protein
MGPARWLLRHFGARVGRNFCDGDGGLFAIFTKASGPPCRHAAWAFAQDETPSFQAAIFDAAIGAVRSAGSGSDTVARTEKAIPTADEIAWSFLADTGDIAALQRFVAAFPSSEHLGEATSLIAKGPFTNYRCGYAVAG